MKITVILPTHNLSSRGHERLVNSLYSLSRQTVPCNVIVSDSSIGEDKRLVRGICQGLPFVHYMWQYNPEGFNMPKLFNRAIEASSTPFVLCTGADYIFSKDCIQRYEENAQKGRAIFKEVMMLNRATSPITFADIDRGSLPRSTRNKFGKMANGIQFAHRDDWHQIGGYDERMAGWGGMDNDVYNRFERAGLEIMWLVRGVIYHQWHAIEKNKTPEDANQSRKNWALRDDPNRPIDVKCLKMES